MIRRDVSSLRRLPVLAMVPGLLVAVLMVGCGAFSGPDDTPVQTYDFTPRAFEMQPDRGRNIVLFIAPMQSAGYDSRHMTYSLRRYEHTFYARSEWADTPPRLIQPLLTQALEASGWFSSVVDVSSNILADIKLDVTLLVLQHDFQPSEYSQGRIVLRVQLTDLNRHVVLATQIFESTQPAPSDDPYGGVVALNIALENVLYDITEFCAATLVNWAPE